MVTDSLRTLLHEAVEAAQEDGTIASFAIPSIEVSHPKQASHGDYSTNLALVAASAIRSNGSKANPRELAQTIVDHLPPSDLVGEVELAGPGFINIRLSDSWLQNQVATIIEAAEKFGSVSIGEGQRWQVEYVSANPTGPLHYGGARNAVLGDVVANVLDAAGFDVQREFYVNDAGTQFGLFVESLFARYAQLLGREVPFPENGYRGEYVTEYAQRIVTEYGDRYLAVEQDAAVGELRSIGRRIVLDEYQTVLGRLGVDFDNWFSEQSLYDSGLVEQVLGKLSESGDLAQRDGATWFLASNYPKNDKDEVVVRSNGQPTYFASDIAYHYDKFLLRGFDRVVNVWAVDHQGHVPRMSAMMQAFGLDPERLIILMYDLVKLVRDGQEVKLSKRSGDLLTIEDVVNEVGADALRFNLLTRSPESTIEFDLDLAVQESNENPVYYVQYSHARICSILERAHSSGFPIASSAADVQLSLLNHPSELDLLRKMLQLEEQVLLAVEKLSPHNLTHYAIDLAKTFNAFYRDCRVLDESEPELTRARLLIAQAARIVLVRVLHLMGVSAPESM